MGWAYAAWTGCWASCGAGPTSAGTPGRPAWVAAYGVAWVAPAAGWGALCELGSRPVIAAVPAKLTTMTETAAAAISGWMRAVVLIDSMVSAPEALCCPAEVD